MYNNITLVHVNERFRVVIMINDEIIHRPTIVCTDGFLPKVRTNIKRKRKKIIFHLINYSTSQKLHMKRNTGFFLLFYFLSKPFINFDPVRTAKSKVNQANSSVLPPFPGTTAFMPPSEPSCVGITWFFSCPVISAADFWVLLIVDARSPSANLQLLLRLLHDGAGK